MLRAHIYNFLFLDVHFDIYVLFILRNWEDCRSYFIVMFVFIAGFIHFVFWIGWTEYGQTCTIGK